MGMFSRQPSPIDPADDSDEHAVIVHIAVSDHFGSGSEVRAVQRLGKRLSKAIKRSCTGEFDGDEFGMGEAVLYMYGPDKDALWAAVEPTLREFPGRPMYALLRAGSPDVEAERVDL